VGNGFPQFALGLAGGGIVVVGGDDLQAGRGGRLLVDEQDGAGRSRRGSSSGCRYIGEMALEGTAPAGRTTME